MTFSTAQGATRAPVERVSTHTALKIQVSNQSSGQQVPGLGWTLPPETQQAILDIEANIRAAEQVSGSVIVR